MKTIVALVYIASVFATSAQTYRITALDTNAGVATGINASGQVCGYSTSATNAARAWRYSPGIGLVDLGSFGGADNRALGINNAGQVTGYSTDASGRAHGFVFNGALVDGGGSGNVFAQRINSAGKVAGFATDTNGNDSAFLFSPPNTFSNLGFIANATLPAVAAAYGVNDFGTVVGIGTGSNNFNRAFRSATNDTLEELGTLGGDESWAYAINNSNRICGTADFVTGDAHAFLFSDANGMTDLGTLGGYTSTAFALDSAGNAVGAAEIVNRTMHAALWPNGGAARDLNELIPANSGWVLTEARGVNDAGQIVGSGLLNGQPRAFLLTPNSGSDTNPPVAVLVANNITNIQFGVQFFSLTFWDDSAMLAASIATNSVRVTGPGGFDQIATRYTAPTTNGIKLSATFYVSTPNSLWNGTNNGVYSVAIEPNTVSDTNGNFMPADVIGTFTVATETKPVVSIGGVFSPVMNQSSNYTLSALSSFPYDSSDVFNFTIDWNNDGSDVQNVSGTNGTQVTHAFSSIGVHTIRVTATDVHGVASADAFASVFVVNPPFPNAWSAAPVLTGNRRLAVGINSNGTLVCFGGLPLKSSKLQAQLLAPGAGAFVDGARVTAQTIGLGAGMDALNRIVVFGGTEPNSGVENVNGYVYLPASGNGPAIANKHIGAHDFAFCADNLHRLYSIGGLTSFGVTNGVERYDALANTWTTLAPMPVKRFQATAVYDGLGHILVIGGFDIDANAFTTTIYSYDIATDTWSQLGNAPQSSIGAIGGRVAALGADGMVYLIGGYSAASVASTEVFMFDPALNEWFTGPNLSVGRGTPAVALGNDGFLYVMGGDNTVNGGGNNGQTTVEKLDTTTAHAPRITSAPIFTTLQAETQFFYQIAATGNPRPTYSLVNPPAGMTLDPTNAFVLWTPTTNQVGSHSITLRASNSVGIAEQVLTITVTPLPGDVTPPTAPTSFGQVFRSANSVTITWSGATDNVGVVGYNFYVLVGSRSRHWALFGSTTNHSSYIANGFTPGAIAAVDAAGNVSPLHIGYTNALTLPAISHVQSTNEPTTIIQGNAFLYTLTVGATPNPGFSSFSGPAGMTFTRVSGPNTNNGYAVVQWQPGALQVGTNTFTVFATNANTTGNSATFTVIVLPNGTDTVPPTPVAQMTASGISFDRCNLSWTPAGDNIGVANYHLVATHFGATSNHVVTLDVPGANTSTVLSGLLAASGYTVVIAPSDAAGNIGSSTSIFLTTLVQPNVTLHIAIGPTPGTLALNWNGLGAQWKFTVESSDSMTAPNWTPVAPTNQWPSLATNLLVAPNSPGKFFRINATPASP